jgi:hypothetical protein
MSALPLTALRPLAYPTTRWHALVCLRSGRVLAFVPAAPPEGRREGSRHAGGTRPSIASGQGFGAVADGRLTLTA